ncbi:MAG: phosphatase [Tractidigestivibacter sp.]|jgi:exopolyphosphatase/guanosine-5'-triphosphate,3'-diphosphate pyrophosphatase|uniref:Ppx/GppA phosphatase family protein n=1 Tax=Tractidigestivibacter sp. TaxID=2847320 RepID=UPI003D92A18E
MHRVAVIDIGTVTCRLAIADVEGTQVIRLGKQSTICNLGQDVDKTGRLAQEAMERVFACVKGYVDEAKKSGAQAACCTLTSAARDAENSPELGAALASLGLDPIVIPGEIEGSLTFLGVSRDFPGKRILVADNGGGSTELAVGSFNKDGLALSWVYSANVGCRRLTERFLSRQDPPSADDLARAHDCAGKLFSEALEKAGEKLGKPEKLVVTGGTVTTLVAVDAELDPYDPAYVHLHELSRADVQALEKKLATLDVKSRAALPGIQPKRAPVILGGAVAIDELMKQTGFDTLTVSESDLLFGLSIVAAAALAGTQSPIVWKPTMRPLA